MKKFFGIFFVMMMMSTVVCAADFIDTSGVKCEYLVDRISALGIVNGTGGNKFEPEKAVTRAEFSKMITEIVAKDIGVKDNVFEDVKGHWGEGYIAKASSLDILNGYSDGTFKPDNSVSYAEAIAIVMRCMGYSNLETSAKSVWYENYISKMKEIGLDKDIEEFEPNTSANRGNIAILLWNMLSSDERVNNDRTMLEEYFPNFNYWNGVKITEVTTYNGKVIYVTEKGNFYKEDDIDFSDLGGLVYGIYDSKNCVVNGMTIDEGMNYKKISGSLKSMTEAGYKVLDCDNISGYGDKNYASYVEIFIDDVTNEVYRVVFYDTRKSYFAEEIKVGDTRVTIESRDVYDQSIVQLKNGQLITYNILRTESVMDVSAKSLLVHDGKVIEWKDVPNDSVVREIVKNKIYTYTHKFVDGKIENGKYNYKSLILNDKEYAVEKNCVCQNAVTKQTMKLTEGLKRDDIIKLGEVDDKVRFYLNEYDEIVKVEFNYNIWEMHELEGREDEYKIVEKHLNNIGFVTRVSLSVNEEGKSIVNEAKVLSLPDSKLKKYTDNDEELAVGDFVYLPSGEKMLKFVSDKVEIDGIEFVLDYKYPVTDNKIGKYILGKDTEVVEVLLTKDESAKKEYAKCELIYKAYDNLYEPDNYKNIHLIVNEDGNVIRLYAIREIGVTINVGTIYDIQEKISGDKLLETKVVLYNKNRNKVSYLTNPVMGYEIGDLITFDIFTNENKKNVIVVGEVYSHHNIGSKYDLIVKSSKDGKITFKNSDLVIDLNSEGFEYNGESYIFGEYAFIKVKAEKNKETSEWLFKTFSITNSKSSFALSANDRIAIDEITNTIIAYERYRD